MIDEAKLLDYWERELTKRFASRLEPQFPDPVMVTFTIVPGQPLIRQVIIDMTVTANPGDEKAYKARLKDGKDHWIQHAKTTFCLGPGCPADTIAERFEAAVESFRAISLLEGQP